MKVQCDLCAGVVSTNTSQKYVCRKRNSMGPPPAGTYIKVLAATVHLHALQSLYSGVKIYTEQWSC